MLLAQNVLVLFVPYLFLFVITDHACWWFYKSSSYFLCIVLVFCRSFDIRLFRSSIYYNKVTPKYIHIGFTLYMIYITILPLVFSVHRLRPGDIKVVGALGDSLTVCEDFSWWRHQMETFSALLALCAGNSPVTVEFPAQRPVTRSFDVFLDLRLE